jgi:integrase
VSGLREHAEDYLRMRRALGYRLVGVEVLLRQFIAYLDAEGATTITVDAAVAWARLPVGARPDWWRRRLSAVRGFARHLHALDPTVEVPPAGLLRCFRDRTPPHLYTHDEVQALLRAADGFPHLLRAATYRTLIGLLAVTGLRVGEAVALDRDDVDLDHAVVTVRDGKFGKSRQVLLHPTAVTALREYVDVRDATAGDVGAPAFFVSTRGRLLVNTVDYTFAALVRTAGLHPGLDARSPRLHDFRHYADGWVMRPAVAFPLVGAAGLVS